MITQSLKDVFNKGRYWGAPQGLGDELNKKKGVVVGKYSFAVQGGAVGSINLRSDLSSAGSLVKLPDNAIVTNVFVDIITAMASAGGTGTVALTLQSAGDLLAAVDADTLANQVQGIPNGAVANMIKLTAERTLSVEIAVEALTAGVFDVFVEYVISD